VWYSHFFLDKKVLQKVKTHLLTSFALHTDQARVDELPVVAVLPRYVGVLIKLDRS